MQQEKHTDIKLFTYFIHVVVSSSLISKVVILMKTPSNQVLSNRPLKLQTVLCYLKFHLCIQKNRKLYALEFDLCPHNSD